MGLWNFSPVCHSIVLKTAQEYELVQPDRERHILWSAQRHHKSFVFLLDFEFWLLNLKSALQSNAHSLSLKYFKNKLNQKFTAEEQRQREGERVCYRLPSNTSSVSCIPENHACPSTMWCPPLEACQLLTRCHQPAGKNKDEKDKGLRMWPIVLLPEVLCKTATTYE